MVQLNVFQRVAYAPVIDVYSRTMVSAAHACQDSQDGRTASHVEYRLALQVAVQQFTDDEARCLVMTCAEGHLGIDDDIVGHLWYVVVEGAVDDATVAYHDGLKKILLPFFIPILVFGFYVAIGNGCIRQREGGHGLAYRIFVIQIFLNIGGDAVSLLYKTFETYFTQDGAEHVVDRLCAGLGVEGKF